MRTLSETASQKSGRVHGGPHDDELRALGVDPALLRDFSVNTNPYGPCQGVVEAVRTAVIERYPDPTARAAREAMAPILGVSPDEVALGNGAADLLWTLARALLRPGSRTLIIEPTFCEFRAAALAARASIVEWRAHESDGFAINLESIARLLHAEGVGVVYLCAPNTPTGTGLPAAVIAAWAEANPRASVVLDQSFLSLSESFADAEVRMPPNVVRVRSLTKEHAIPGVRLGYLLASPDIVDRLEENRPAWMTSAMAQAAAVAACRERSFVEESRRKLLADRERLLSRIRSLDVATFASSTGFFLVRVKGATELRRRLLSRHQILVRDCLSFGLPDFIRLAARPEPDAQRLVAALKEELARC